MSLCRYNEKTAVSSSICKNAHWYNSLSADSTLYDASSYSNYYVLWCIIRVSLGGSLLFLLHESQLLFTAVEVTVTCDIYADDCTSAWQWSHETATEHFISCLWQITSAWQWSHQIATEHFISCLWQITSAWQWSHQTATEHFISCLWQITSAWQWSHQTAT